MIEQTRSDLPFALQSPAVRRAEMFVWEAMLSGCPQAVQVALQHPNGCVLESVV